MGGDTGAKLNDSWNHDHVYLICPDLGVNWIQNECHVRKIHGCQLLSYRGCFVFWNIKRDFCRFHLILFGSKVDFSWFKKKIERLWDLSFSLNVLVSMWKRGTCFTKCFLICHFITHTVITTMTNMVAGCSTWCMIEMVVIESFFFCLNDFLNPPTPLPLSSCLLLVYMFHFCLRK